MVLLKSIKYSWKESLIYFVFLALMFYSIGGYIFEFTRLYTVMNPYDYVDSKNTYKIESGLVIENDNESTIYNLSNLKKLLEQYDNYEGIDGYASAMWCPGKVIQPELGTGINCLYYINHNANEVLKLDYLYGGWFDESEKVPQVVLGNGWAEYYDAGDDIKIYFGDLEILECDFKVAGVLDVNSCPSFSGIYSLGLPYGERGDDYNVYFNSFDFLSETEYLYTVDLRTFSTNSIYNVLIRTDNIDEVKNSLNGYEIKNISYYYTESFKEIMVSGITQELILFILLTIFGVIAIVYSTGRKNNLLYYILSLNGLSKKYFIFINIIQTFFVILLAAIPMIINQLLHYRLSFENTTIRVLIMALVIIIIESIFVIMSVAISRKKLYILYRESLEN